MIFLQTVIPAIALVLILIGIWKEEKLIAFENRVWKVIKTKIFSQFIR